jgi:hypothetical protein
LRNGGVDLLKKVRSRVSHSFMELTSQSQPFLWLLILKIVYISLVSL